MSCAWTPWRPTPKLPDETMQELNYRVEVLEEPVEQVARDSLKSADLVD